MGPWFDFLLACKSLNQINDIEERLKKIGTIFKFKGTKPTIEDLPTEGNEPGDVWSVAGIEYVWAVNESGEGHWEPLGDIIDMDNYVMKADIVQQLGEAEDKIMSQKATKDAIQAYETSMFKELNKVKDYFYTVEYDNIDYAFANKYYETSNDPVEASGCSAVRNGNWYGRNFDWTYDESVDFLVRVPRTNTRYASMGIANGGSALNRQVVQSGIFSDDYRIVPFKVVDGINEKGLVVNSNVVPVDKDPTTGTVPRLEKRESLNMMMLVRYILDNFDDAKKAVEYIRDYVEVTPYAMLSDMGYELHLMVCDKEQSYVLEFAHNAVSIINVADKPYMTNFFLTDFTPNADGTVYTPATKDATHSAMTTNGVTEHGDGLERYNLIVGNYASAATKAGMRALMNRLKYTRAYSTAPDVSSPYWYTEFVGGDLTVDSDVSAFASVVEKGGELFANRSRSKTSPYYGTWQSTHSCVYDIDEKKVYVIVQEDGQEMEYGFEFYYDAKEVDAIAEDINERIDDEVQTLNTRIDTEVETLNTRIDTEVETLNDKIDSKGHYLGLWDSTTGLCTTNLAVGTQYVPGDSFIVSKVGSGLDNLIINGSFDDGREGWTSTDDSNWTVQDGQLRILNASTNSDLQITPSFTEELLPNTTYTVQVQMNTQTPDIYFVVALDWSGKKDTRFELRESGQFTFTTLSDMSKFSMNIFKPKWKTGTATFDSVMMVQGSSIPSGDTNRYKPNGSEYTGVKKELKDDNKVKVNDSYIYDGEEWRWQKNTETDIEIDDELNEDSINPVQNKVVTAALEDIDDNLSTLSALVDTKASTVEVQTLIGAETNRALAAEQQIQGNLTNEINRATAAEQEIKDLIPDVSGFATKEELADAVEPLASKEEVASQISELEEELQSSIISEVTRATAAEQEIAEDLTAEISRATAAEQAITASIPDISGLATKQELENAIEPLAIKEDVTEEIELAVADKPTQTEMGEAISTAVSTKQETLVSGTNIKTINGQSVLGSGNIEIVSEDEITYIPVTLRNETLTSDYTYAQVLSLYNQGKNLELIVDASKGSLEIKYCIPLNEYSYFNPGEPITPNGNFEFVRTIRANGGADITERYQLDENFGWMYSAFNGSQTYVSRNEVKTINGQSIIGEGSISIKTLSPMKDEWLEASTTEDAVEMIFDDGAQVGEGYLGTVLWGDLPGGLGGAECKAFVISDGIILFELNSADTPPYNWQYNSFAGEWRPLVEPTADGITTLTVNGTEAGSWSANQEEDNTIELTIPTDYVTEDTMNDAIEEATKNLATKESVTSAINTAISDKVTTDQMNTAISTATSGLATAKSVIDEQDRAISVEGTLSGRITALSSTVDNKANSSTVTTLSNTVSALTTTVNNKADKDELPLHVRFYRYQGSPTCNVTYAELKQAFIDHKPIVATLNQGQQAISGTIAIVFTGGEVSETIVGSFLSCTTTIPKILKVIYTTDNTWTSESITLAIT